MIHEAASDVRGSAVVRPVQARRSRWLSLLAALALALTMLVPLSTSAEGEAVGGPVILMGLDSELAPGTAGHGPPEEHADMVQSVLDNVRNGGSGILVIGDGTDVRAYWETEVGARVGESVDFVSGPTDIAEVDFDGYAMIGVASSQDQLRFGNGLDNDENEALVARDLDIAAFINDGGGLIGKTQDGMDNPFGYVGPLGDFDVLAGIDGIGYEDIQVTEAGEALGLTQDGMSGWCCWHDVFLDFPEFMDVLVVNTDQSSVAEGEAAAIGGVDVVVPTGIDLEPESAELEVGETHEVTATVEEDDAPAEDVEVTFTVTEGPHEGTTGTATTDEDGQASFSYEGTEEGTDRIVATFVDLLERERTSNTVTATWEEADGVYPPDPDAEVYPPDPEVLGEVLEAEEEEAEPATPIEAEPDFTG